MSSVNSRLVFRIPGGGIPVFTVKTWGPLHSDAMKDGILRKRKSRSESADDLSDINDAEITGYLNKKTEMPFETLVWEAMNKDYPKRKQRKSTIAKKSTHAKKAVASRTVKGEEEHKENKKSLSSKINYDALEKLTDKPKEITEEGVW